jgi:hypothetical protein
LPKMRRGVHPAHRVSSSGLSMSPSMAATSAAAHPRNRDGTELYEAARHVRIVLPHDIAEERQRICLKRAVQYYATRHGAYVIHADQDARELPRRILPEPRFRKTNGLARVSWRVAEIREMVPTSTSAARKPCRLREDPAVNEHGRRCQWRPKSVGEGSGHAARPPAHHNVSVRHYNVSVKKDYREFPEKSVAVSGNP